MHHRHCLGVCLSIHRSVCLSHSWAISNWCMLRLQNLHCGLTQEL